jgi:hypothetical protein
VLWAAIVIATRDVVAAAKSMWWVAALPSLRAKQSNPEAAFAMHNAAPQQAVIPANAGIQCAAASHSIIGASEYWIIRFRG